jgi:negative regulator of replication initiation
MRLEVIADDVYFEPWSSDFSVITNKKVSVQIAEQEEEKPKMKVQVVEQKEEEKPVKKQVSEIKQVKKSDNSFTKEEIIKRLLGSK